jgi:hypothetical protein
MDFSDEQDTRKNTADRVLAHISAPLAVHNGFSSELHHKVILVLRLDALHEPVKRPSPAAATPLLKSQAWGEGAEPFAECYPVRISDGPSALHQFADFRPKTLRGPRGAISGLRVYRGDHSCADSVEPSRINAYCRIPSSTQPESSFRLHQLDNGFFKLSS